MKHYILRRRYFKHGTFSYLYGENGESVCCFVERPDLNNTPSESCIPEGTYHLLPHQSPKFGHCYAVEEAMLGVTRYGPSLRTHVLIHKANVPSDLEGCLAPGVDFGYIKGQWGVVNSTVAFNALMQAFAGETVQLTIVKD